MFYEYKKNEKGSNLRLHISYEDKYILQTFPKSGCTSLELLFDELTSEQKLPNGVLKTCEIKTVNDFINFSPIFNKLVKSDDYFIISVVRNTYERVLSMYFNIVLGVNDENSVIKNNYTFDRFLNWLQDNNFSLDWLGHEIISKSHHFNPQYLFKSHNYKVNRYIYLNELDEKLPKLFQNKFSIDEKKVRNILKNNRENSFIKKYYDVGCKLNDYDFHKDYLNLKICKNGIPSKKSMFTDKNIDMINKLYKTEINYHKFEVNL